MSKLETRTASQHPLFCHCERSCMSKLETRTASQQTLF